MANNLGDMFERRIKVPWIFLDEWKRVYDDVYSKDIELQRRGYEKMLLWKARQSQLPAGVECTLELVHVHIIDQEVSQQISNRKRPMYAEHDMQLMCSSAVMRYLNHVSNVVKTSDDTLYSMAEKVNIPNWMVMLRHDAAHSTALPSLAVLRMAVDFALEWLHENYWKMVSSVPELVVSKTDHFTDKRVGEYLDVWQSLKMYQINGYGNIDEIPDQILRRFIMQLLHKNIDPNAKESDVWTEDTRKLSHCATSLRVKLFQAIRADHSKLEKLITLILESESFIPPVSYLTNGNEEELSHETVLTWLCKFWKKFLVPYQEDFGLFPTLVHKLVILINKEECKHRQLVMALWIKQLCISMLKSQAILKETYTIERNMSDRMKKTEQLKPKIHHPDLVMKKFDKKNPHLQHGFLALLNDPKGNSCPVADVKFAVLNPNEFTMIFLPSLCDVASPQIPDASRLLLEELLSIWLKTTDISIANADKVIHTVEDLYKIGGKGISKATFFGDGVISKLQMDFNSEHNWATCPLGILPWQKESKVILDMPSHVTWTLSTQNVNATVTHSKTLIKTPYVKDKVNWHKVAKNISSVRAKLKTRRMKKKKLKNAARLHLQQT